MPIISMFFGIAIRMFFEDTGQHKTPHFHAVYGDYQAVFSLDGEKITGDFPPKQIALVKAWAILHDEALAADWALAVNGEETFRIPPLN